MRKGGWAPPGYGAVGNPPIPTPLGWGHPQCSPVTPLGRVSPGLTSSKTLLGGSRGPPPSVLQHPRAPGPAWGLFCPSPGPAEPVFADGLIKAPLAKAAQRDKMLLEAL